LSEKASATTPEEYLAALEEPRRTQITELHDLIRETAPQLEPHIQAGMLAYGRYHYRYASGREGDWFPIGVASQKGYISLFITAATEGHEALADSFRERLPKADIGRSCVRFKRLEDLDRVALTELIREAAKSADAQT
jgi:hypothetical protein